MSAAHKGELHHQWGKSPSEETKEKIRLGLIGNKLSPESIVKRTASRSGYKHSEETKAKIREANKLSMARRKAA